MIHLLSPLLLPLLLNQASAQSQSECRLYLAPSSTSDPPTTLGLFTSIDLPPNTTIGEPELAIQLIDLETHHPDLPTAFLLENMWTSERSLGQYESSDTVRSVIPGLATLGAFHPSMFNAALLPPVQHPDKDGVEEERGRHDAGAFSAYHNSTIASNRWIRAGQEILVDFGQDFADSEKKNDESRPTVEDFAMADDILRQFSDVLSKHAEELSSKTKREVWKLLLEKVISNEKVRKMLPQNVEDVDKVLESGTEWMYNSDVNKSLQWLERNGHCVDNLYSQKSGVLFAGRGAFARRDIKKGEVISVVPLLPIMDTDYMNMYQSDPETNSTYQSGKQLMLNYCFGHPKMSFLLFPASPMVNYINHNADANVEVRWLEMKRKYFPRHWLSLSQSELKNEMEKLKYPALIMDYVATRDIAANEEVFLNYGSEWEEAWNHHVQTWIPPSYADGYISASMMNKKKDGEPFRTKDEQKTDPYPKNVFTACFLVAGDRLPSEGGTKIYKWKSKEGLFEGESLHPCRILERQEDTNGEEGENNVNYEYYVIALVEENHIGFVGIPHEAIRFMDLPYSSSQHLDGAFRHVIGLPDDMFSWLKD